MGEIENEKPKTARQDIYDLVQGHAGNSEITQAPEDAVLVGFLLIAEWESPDGTRWISKNSGNAFRQLPPWTERGLSSEIVFGSGWDEPDEGEEDDEDD